VTRAEHLAWCKQRALEYVDRGDLAQALASMISDLGKHPDTRSSVLAGAIIAPLEFTNANNSAHVHQVRKWIEGFN
jgi:hypothetical protein